MPVLCIRVVRYCLSCYCYCCFYFDFYSYQLYAWGVGAAGRLGLDITEKGDPQADSINPKVVQALLGRAVIKVSLGHSHTGCVVAGGDLFMFGSANSGKCGLGRVSDTEECYCSIPTRVPVGLEDRPVRRVSCGSSHTAVCTENGLLYVFGSGELFALSQYMCISRAYSNR